MDLHARCPFGKGEVLNIAQIARTVATLGPVGYLPIAPGTWGSGVAAILWWFIAPKATLFSELAIIGILIPIAIMSANRSERELGHDAKPIVIDEVAGQWITLLTAPRIWYIYVAGFILFRIFDVLKPFPVYQSQKFPGGYGIVTDDILAGLYAMMTLLILQKVFLG